MNNIKEILEKEDSSIEELINCFDQIKNNGDVAVIKFDGEREEDQYTVFITFPNRKDREMIRADESILKNALIKVLKDYTETPG